MRTARTILIFSGIGLALSGIVAGLASLAPSIFGWFTLPFWLLPAIANLGSHDVGWGLFAVSGTLCYGSLALFIWRWLSRRKARRTA